MRISIFFAFLLLLNIPLRAEIQPLSVAVLDFESKDEPIKDLGQKVSALVAVQLSAEPNIITVERAELEKVLSEQELGLSGTIAPDTAARVGNLTGAKVLVTGRVFKAGTELIVVCKIIGTETGRVFGELTKGAATTPVTELSAELAKKISATIAQRGETLVAKVPTWEELVSKIKKGLPQGTLPKVSISLPEKHYGQAANDPAAESELGKLLKECGFTLVDDTAQPDVKIMGEAFSAFGLRKGNLISCKARIEVKVRRQNGEILVVDRQTSAAVDISEQTAAKTALQQAAMDLAARLLPQLTR